MQASFLGGYLRFGNWATRRTLEAVKALSEEEFSRDLKGPFGGVRGSLAHMYECDLFFYAMLSGEEPPPPAWLTDEVWGDAGKAAVTREGLDRDYRALLDRWDGLAARLDDPAAAAAFADASFEAHGATLPKWQGLVNVVSHGTYHRGQVATFLRQLGHAPLGTDIIRFHFETAGLTWPY